MNKKIRKSPQCSEMWVLMPCWQCCWKANPTPHTGPLHWLHKYSGCTCKKPPRRSHTIIPRNTLTDRSYNVSTFCKSLHIDLVTKIVHMMISWSKGDNPKIPCTIISNCLIGPAQKFNCRFYFVQFSLDDWSNVAR